MLVPSSSWPATGFSSSVSSASEHTRQIVGQSSLCAASVESVAGSSVTRIAPVCGSVSHAEGEGGVARREDLTATAAATLERSAGTVAHGTRAARERRRRRAKVSRRRRAAGAPWEELARAARFKRARLAPLVGAPPQGATRRQLFSRARLPHSVDWVSMVFIEHMRTTVLPTGWRQDTAWIEPR